MHIAECAFLMAVNAGVPVKDALASVAVGSFRLGALYARKQFEIPNMN